VAAPLAAVALIAALPAAAPARDVARETLREASRVTVAAEGLRRIEVDNSRGVIEARPGTAGTVSVVAVKTVRAPSAETARRLADRITVETRRDAGAWRLVVRYPQREQIRIGWRELFSGVDLPSMQVRVTIEVPPGVDLLLKTVSGELLSVEVPNPQALESTSGDIEIRETRGPVRVSSVSGEIAASLGGPGRLRSTSGDVEVRGARGPLEVNTTSGEIDVRDAADSLSLGSVSGGITVVGALRGVRAGTTSGTVTARDVAGSVALGTSSGDIVATLGPDVRRLEAATTSGDIELRVHPSAGATFDLRTSNGTLDADLPITVDSVTRRRLTGRVGTGSTPVFLRSSSGDIQITSGGS
jgi:DUF4097 and DUF4098 domain-containing protein YvlB